MHGKQFVVGLVCQEVCVRSGQLESEQRRRDAPEHEEHNDGHQVHNADALVIDGQQPAFDGGFRIDVMHEGLLLFLRGMPGKNRFCIGRNSVDQGVVGRVHWSPPVLGRQGFYVGDERLDVFFGQLAVDRHHGGWMGGYDFFHRLQNRLANIVFVFLVDIIGWI